MKLQLIALTAFTALAAAAPATPIELPSKNGVQSGEAGKSGGSGSGSGSGTGQGAGTGGAASPGAGGDDAGAGDAGAAGQSAVSRFHHVLINLEGANKSCVGCKYQNPTIHLYRCYLYLIHEVVGIAGKWPPSELNLLLFQS